MIQRVETLIQPTKFRVWNFTPHFNTFIQEVGLLAVSFITRKEIKPSLDENNLSGCLCSTEDFRFQSGFKIKAIKFG